MPENKQFTEEENRKRHKATGRPRGRPKGSRNTNQAPAPPFKAGSSEEAQKSVSEKPPVSSQGGGTHLPPADLELIETKADAGFEWGKEGEKDDETEEAHEASAEANKDDSVGAETQNGEGAVTLTERETALLLSGAMKAISVFAKLENVNITKDEADVWAKFATPCINKYLGSTATSPEGAFVIGTAIVFLLKLPAIMAEMKAKKEGKEVQQLEREIQAEVIEKPKSEIPKTTKEEKELTQKIKGRWKA